jgi:predicted short-subunit dehydrogenase-like oxidoreductase (DUF2520 family)
MSTSITLVGAGHLAYHLGKALADAGCQIDQVFSRTFAHAEELASIIGAQPITSIKAVENRSQLYIIAVSDDAIEKVAEALQAQIGQDKIVVHTSGATPATILAPFFIRYGVFYPLQSFSRAKETRFQDIPICIYSNDAQLERQLSALARQLSHSVEVVDDAERKALHIAAVFANNFTNYLFHIAHSLSNEHNVSFELLLPLIQETVDKLHHQPPKANQTGPARRGDLKTASQHLAALAPYPEYQQLYEILSQQIFDLYHK